MDEKGNVLDDLIERSGGCAVVDGGFDTAPPSMIARCLIKDPHFIKRATLPGFQSRGLSTEEAESLLTKSVQIAVEARDKFWASSSKRKAGHNNYNRALVEASIGSCGAYLADGSEYSRNYGPNVTLDKLKDFHRRRLQVLVEAGPDFLAFETIPNKLEAQSCVELLDEEEVRIPSWICFSSVDGKNAPSGESFKDCLNIINKSSEVSAVGINCAPPHFVLSLIQRFKEDEDRIEDNDRLEIARPRQGKGRRSRSKANLRRHTAVCSSNTAVCLLRRPSRKNRDFRVF